jgi:hypothetical protein
MVLQKLLRLLMLVLLQLLLSLQLLHLQQRQFVLLLLRMLQCMWRRPFMVCNLSVHGDVFCKMRQDGQ